MNSLQVVMTYATDYHYRLRCLPGFLPKSYMNKYIFDGVTLPNHHVNEIYVWHKSILLDASNKISPREQLCALFQVQGIPETFDYLSDIAKTSASSFFVHQNLYKQVYVKDSLNSTIQNNINELIHDCFSDNSNIMLPEIITGTTYSLLQNISAFLQKKKF